VATGPSIRPIATSELPVVTSINGVSPTKSSPALRRDWRKPCEAAVAPSLDIIVIPACKAGPSSGGLSARGRG
jgi:hypothetical protein